MGPLLTFSLAHALSTFPGEVNEHLGMECFPSCQLCHTTPAGGAGTATQPFAEEMIREGLNIADPGSLSTALDALQAQGADADVDGDGQNDVDQLAAGENPNADGTDFCPADGGDAPPPLERGCFGGGAAMAVGLVVGGLRWRQSRR
jgi:hypothetical protein